MKSIDLTQDELIFLRRNLWPVVDNETDKVMDTGEDSQDMKLIRSIFNKIGWPFGSDQDPAFDVPIDFSKTTE